MVGLLSSLATMIAVLEGPSNLARNRVLKWGRIPSPRIAAVKVEEPVGPDSRGRGNGPAGGSYASRIERTWAA
jgi:hypothetical protein